MSLPGNLEDREYRKFVISPTRTNQTAVEVVGTLSVGATTPTTAEITNQLAVLSGTEYSFSLPSNCKSFKIKARQICRIRIAYVSGDTNVQWYTVPLGGVFEDNNFYSSQDIFYQVDRANTDIEIVTYV